MGGPVLVGLLEVCGTCKSQTAHDMDILQTETRAAQRNPEPGRESERDLVTGPAMPTAFFSIWQL